MQAAVVSGPPDAVAGDPADEQPSRPAPITAKVAKRRVGAVGVELVAGEGEEPGPHRVQLPHVPEVAERGEPDAAIARTTRPAWRGSKTAPRERERALADAASRRAPPAAVRTEVTTTTDLPVEPAEPVDEVRRAPSRR